jgi:hypothetical protein
MIHNRAISVRCYDAKQKQKRVELTIVTCRSYPDYDPVKSIDEKFLPEGAD